MERQPQPQRATAADTVRRLWGSIARSQIGDRSPGYLCLAW